MKTEEIAALYLRDPLKVGPRPAENYFKSGRTHRITLVDGVKICIQELATKGEAWTTIFSAVGWSLKEAFHKEEVKEAKPAATKAPEAKVVATPAPVKKTPKPKPAKRKSGKGLDLDPA